MSTFCCERCGYTANLKKYLQSHLKRKNPCKALLTDVPQSTLLERLLQTKTKVPQVQTEEESPNDVLVMSAINKSLAAKKSRFENDKVSLVDPDDLKVDLWEHWQYTLIANLVEHNVSKTKDTQLKVYFFRMTHDDKSMAMKTFNMLGIRVYEVEATEHCYKIHDMFDPNVPVVDKTWVDVTPFHDHVRVVTLLNMYQKKLFDF